MNPRVNLLPAHALQRLRERRQVMGLGGALAAMLVVLVSVALVQSARLDSAVVERDTEQASARQLEHRRGELEHLRALPLAVEARESALVRAMATEVSFGGVMLDLTTAVPAGTSLTALTLDLEVVPDPLTAEAALDDETVNVGAVTISGYSVDRFAPGLADMLVGLESTVGLSDLRLLQGTDDEIGATPVTTFDALARLDGTALTGRYLVGLPVDRRPMLPAAPLPPPAALPTAPAAPAPPPGDGDLP